MGLNVANKLIFGLLLSLVGHVNQRIKPTAFGIAIDDSPELLFVQIEKLSHRRAEPFHEKIVFLTPPTASRNNADPAARLFPLA